MARWFISNDIKICLTFMFMKIFDVIYSGAGEKNTHRNNTRFGDATPLPPKINVAVLECGGTGRVK